MSVQTIDDKYNPNKKWIVTKTSCRHYYMQQKICGKPFGKKVRTTKRHLKEIGVLQ